jgi:hypothetical protein
VKKRQTITLYGPEDEIEVVRTGTAGHHSLLITLSEDGSILVRTENYVIVPGLGELPEERLMDEHPGPIQIIQVRWPFRHDGPESDGDDQEDGGHGSEAAE